MDTRMKHVVTLALTEIAEHAAHLSEAERIEYLQILIENLSSRVRLNLAPRIRLSDSVEANLCPERAGRRK